MIVVTVEIKVQPGKEKDYEAIGLEAARLVESEEPGNLFFAVHRTDDPSTYMIVARFKDAAALKAHEDGAHLADTRARFADVIAAPPSRSRYEQIT